MAAILIFISFSGFTSDSDSYKESPCYKEYKKKEKSKSYYESRDPYLGSGIGAGGGIVHIFSSEKEYAPEPPFETKILEAADYSLSLYREDGFNLIEPPKLLLKAKKKSKKATLSDIQKAIRVGFVSGDFCSGIFNKRPNGVIRYALKKIREQENEKIIVRSPAVVDGEGVKDIPEVKTQESIKPSSIKK